MPRSLLNKDKEFDNFDVNFNVREWEVVLIKRRYRRKAFSKIVNGQQVRFLDP